MPLNIKDSETHRMARRLAELTGETLTKAVGTAVRERLARVEGRQKAGRRRLAARLSEIAEHCAALPVLDARLADEIIGYDEEGLPG